MSNTGLKVKQFIKRNEKDAYYDGDLVEAVIEASWNPKFQGGSDIVTIRCYEGTYEFDPPEVTVTVRPNIIRDKTEVSFKIVFGDPPYNPLLKIFAVDKNGNEDSIRINYRGPRS